MSRLAGRTKEHLPESYANLARCDIERTLHAMVDVIVDDLLDTGVAEMQGFATFKVYEYGGRRYYNPYTGEHDQHTEPCYRVVARIARNVRASVNGDGGSDYAPKPSAATKSMAGRVRERIDCLLTKEEVADILVACANTCIDDLMDNGQVRIPGIITVKVFKAPDMRMNLRTGRIEPVNGEYRISCTISPQLKRKMNEV